MKEEGGIERTYEQQPKVSSELVVIALGDVCAAQPCISVKWRMSELM